MTVVPTLETQSVYGGGTATQGAAFWVHPSNPALSQLLVGDNQTGLLFYNMDGGIRAQLAEGAVSGVDVQDGVPVAGTNQPLIMVVNATSGLVSYTIDTSDGGFPDAGFKVSKTAFPNIFPRNVASLVTLYRGEGGRLYAFSAGTAGIVEQFEINLQTDGGTGDAGTGSLRTLNVGSAITGLVVDDIQKKLYVAERNLGIWQYEAEPDGGTARVSVDNLTGALVSPLAGLALYAGPDTQGYLLALAGDNAVRIYERNPTAHTFKGTFTVASDGGIDAVERPRVLAVEPRLLDNKAFPQGVVAVQDSSNTGGNENFKLVPWQTIASSYTPPLITYSGPPQLPDAGVDGGGTGLDGGVRPPREDTDAGVYNPPEPTGCSCSSTTLPGSVLLALVGLMLARRRSQG